jgi:prephenate dehydratase
LKKRLEMKIGFLGPKGTFSEDAVHLYIQHISLSDYELIPFSSFADVGEAVLQQKVDIGILPTENSLEGQVSAANDVLIAEEGIKAAGEIILPIHINFIGKEGSEPEHCTHIYSHPQPLGQCAKFLRTRFPDAHYIISSSTSQAVVDMLNSPEPAPFALANTSAAQLHHAKIILEDVQDSKENYTRFLVISKKDHKQTGCDKTSICYMLQADQVGSLYNSLQPFKEKNINLTRIETRPTKKELGTYIFLLDLQGHRLDPNIKDALKQIQSLSMFFRIIGSYPQWS